jgi:hypothetical protein
MNGVITTIDVVKHAATIVREFGPAAFLRCCLIVLGRRKATFLESGDSYRRGCEDSPGNDNVPERVLHTRPGFRAA